MCNKATRIHLQVLNTVNNIKKESNYESKNTSRHHGCFYGRRIGFGRTLGLRHRPDKKTNTDVWILWHCRKSHRSIEEKRKAISPIMEIRCSCCLSHFHIVQASILTIFQPSGRRCLKITAVGWTAPPRKHWPI